METLGPGRAGVTVRPTNSGRRLGVATAPRTTKSTLFIRIQLPNGDRFGPGKAQLLAAIERTGSISEAARSIRMSYRRAWLLVDGAGKSFGRPLVSAATGGRRGGGATLTPFGRAVLASYSRLAKAAASGAAEELRRFDRWAGE